MLLDEKTYKLLSQAFHSFKASLSTFNTAFSKESSTVRSQLSKLNPSTRREVVILLAKLRELERLQKETMQRLEIVEKDVNLSFKRNIIIKDTFE